MDLGVHAVLHNVKVGTGEEMYQSFPTTANFNPDFQIKP
jgi:hypothetical protein